ncbi:Transmembrane domain-containing protein [Spironucleus salmonicida]|uniref:Transmembrane domain-containing protein n=1 Tax=Spironucleus salmonicida TaxID=348837 RepID=V6LY93_9EUKA|nr:Transmembrane domain-containing protein [Spironucleus salmonicida]|eukprot:EST49203.1 Transmembrane domain-containing protein [Spironucleus salmonicida]
MNNFRTIQFKSHARQLNLITISDTEIQEAFKTSVISKQTLEKQICYCQVSMKAAQIAIGRSKILSTLLKDTDFQSTILNLVSSICCSFWMIINDSKFLNLILECFKIDQREEYAQLLEIQQILKFIDKDQIEFFAIIVEKMLEFDHQVFNIIQQFITFPATTYALICIRNLFIKFPEQMNSQEMFKIICKNFEHAPQVQQQELVGIIEPLLYLQIISSEQISQILNIFTRKVYLFECQLHLIDLFSQFMQIPIGIIQLIKQQSEKISKTQKYSIKLLKQLQ